MTQCGFERLEDTTIRMWLGDCKTYNFNGIPKVLLCWPERSEYGNRGCYT